MKLYWRYKKNGAWTWKAAVCEHCEWHLEDGTSPCCDINKEEA